MEMDDARGAARRQRVGQRLADPTKLIVAFERQEAAATPGLAWAITEGPAQCLG